MDIELLPYQSIGGHEDVIEELRYLIELPSHPEYSKEIKSFPQGIIH